MVNRCKRKIYFEGIDTSWNRVKGKYNYYLKLQQNTIITIQQSIPNLAKAYAMMKALDENHWVPLKSEAIKKL
jgi:ribosomal protein S2